MKNVETADMDDVGNSESPEMENPEKIVSHE